MNASSGSERTRVKRVPHKQDFDPEKVGEILSHAIHAHVAISLDGQPFAIPVACAPYRGELLLHGSTASRLFRALADGSPACVTVTLVQALVLARSSFESSMHYQSLMALGRARALEGDEKLAALRALTDHLFPERRKELRPSSDKELSATAVVSFPLNEVSVKISKGQPDDPTEDLSAEIWAGILPMTTLYGKPIPAENLLSGIEPPEYLSRWLINRL